MLEQHSICYAGFTLGLSGLGWLDGVVDDVWAGKGGRKEVIRARYGRAVETWTDSGTWTDYMD